LDAYLGGARALKCDLVWRVVGFFIFASFEKIPKGGGSGSGSEENDIFWSATESFYLVLVSEKHKSMYFRMVNFVSAAAKNIRKFSSVWRPAAEISDKRDAAFLLLFLLCQKSDIFKI
jgi:hypothetical protein